MCKSKETIIIQPIIPHYRLSLFDKLVKLGDYKVLASPTDFSGLKSCPTAAERSYAKEIGEFVKIPFFSAYWQKGALCKETLFGKVVVVSGNPRVVNHMLVFLFRKLIGKPVVWWGQGWTANSRGVSAKFRRYIMNYADGIVLYTSKEADEFRTNKAIIGLDNGIDIEPIKKSVNKVGREIVRDLAVLKLVFIGRLTEKVNLIWLLKCLKKVKRNVSLTIIGDGPLFQELEDCASELPDNIQVILTGSVYDPDEIALHMCSSDAFIYPGSVGLSLIHAFAHGLPALLVGDSSRHMPEYSAFEDGLNGFTLPLNDRDAAQFLDYLSIETLHKMSASAKKTVVTQFNTDVMADRFHDLIKGLR